jgi:hypothetical protein
MRKAEGVPVVPEPITGMWLVRSPRQRWDCCGGHSAPRGWLLQVHYKGVPAGEGGQWFFSRSKRRLKHLRTLLVFDGGGHA